VVLAGLGAFAGRGGASDEAAIRDEILKIADAIEKGDADAARKQADALAAKVDVLTDVMALFRLRMRKGIGVGPTPNAIKPDGIEAKIMALGKKAPTPKEATSEGPGVAHAAYVTAAIAEIALRKPAVDKKEGEKDPAKWKEWSEAMRKSSEELAQAAKAGKGPEVKAAATRLNASCNHCHEVFRDA
jgi:cytochrome c556